MLTLGKAKDYVRLAGDGPSCLLEKGTERAIAPKAKESIWTLSIWGSGWVVMLRITFVEPVNALVDLWWHSIPSAVISF